MLLDQNYAIRQCTFGFSNGIVAGWVLVNLVPPMQIPEKCTKFSNFTLKKISGRKKKKKSLKHGYAISLSYSHGQKVAN